MEQPATQDSNLEASSANPLIGQQVGSYILEGFLGEGGMGEVFRGRHHLVGKLSAVKVLKPEHSVDKSVVERFFHEAQTASKAKHPGIVDVYDFGFLDNGQAYLIMELLEGNSLGALLSSGTPLPEKQAANLLWHIASAVASLHQHGITHRDLKPDNVFVIKDSAAQSGERTKVLDFGISKLTEATNRTDSPKTLTGFIVGTPRYMSPEQCAAKGPVDYRTDIYSLGCIAFEMVTGRAVFEREGVGEVLAAHIVDAPPRARDLGAQISESFEVLIAASLSKDPAQRPNTMDSFASALAQIRELAPTGEHHPYGSPASNQQDLSTQFVRMRSEAQFQTSPGLARTSDVFDTNLSPGVPGPARWIVAALLILLLASGLLLFTREEAAPGESSVAEVAPVPTTEEITLGINSEPPGAAVYRRSDGVRIGETPWTKDMPPVSGGLLDVRITKEGFVPKELSLRTDRTGAYRVRLTELPQEKSAPPQKAPDVTRRRTPKRKTITKKQRAWGDLVDE